MPPLVPLKPHKMPKTQNIKNPLCISLKGIIYKKYTDFQPILSIFEGPVTFSVEKKVTISRRGIRAKWMFFGQKSANFENFPKILQNLIKLIEIHVWSEFQLIWSIFGHFIAILRPFLGHFSLYIKYGKIAIFYQTSTHVCVYKSRTVDFSIQHITYQIEEEELLFATVLKLTKNSPLSNFKGP